MTARRHANVFLKVAGVFAVVAVASGSLILGSRLVPEDSSTGENPTTLSPTPVGQAEVGPVEDASRIESDGGIKGHTTLNGGLEADFVVSFEGSYWFESTRGEVAAYDVNTLTLEIDADAGTVVVTGLPPSGPDAQHAYLLAYLRMDTTSWLVEAAEQQSGLRPSLHLGRPTEEWEGTDLSERLESMMVARDQSTGLPMIVVQQQVGDTRDSTWVVDSLIAVSVDELLEITFRAGVDKDSAGVVRERGFSLVRLEDLDALAGYSVPRVGWIPDGFVLSSVAFAHEPESDVNLVNPPSIDVAVLTFRRGLETFTVTTRRATVELLHEGSSEVRPWLDPYCVAQPCDPISKEVVGTFEFSLVAGPLTTTHAWAIAEGMVVTVGGDLSVTDLKAILSGLTG